MWLAHIAGIPVEETVLSFGPIALAGGGVLGLKIRQRVNARRERRHRAGSARAR
jgi:hypothetical protein